MSKIESQIEKMLLEQIPKELVIPMSENKDTKTLILSILELVKENNDRLKDIQYRIRTKFDLMRTEKLFKHGG